jgi:uncharacterized protein (DUF885 family)
MRITATLALGAAMMFTLPLSAVAADQAESQLSALEARIAASTWYYRSPTNPVKFTDYSPAGFQARMQEERGVLADLAAVNRDALPHYIQLTYDAIKWDAERVLDREPYGLLQFPYSPYEFIFDGPNSPLERFRFAADADADAYLHLASQYRAAVDSIIAQIANQRDHGIYIQRDEAAHIRMQMANYVKAPVDSFAWPSDARLRALSPRKLKAFRQALAPMISEKINPALRALANQFDDKYQAAAPTRYGLAQYPGGKEYYKVLVKFRLTIDKTPEEIFRESQAMLDTIDSDMTALRADMGYVGSRKEFDAQLATNPKYIAKSTADVERTYMGYLARIDRLLPKLFCHPAPYGYAVKRASPDEEATLAYGRAGLETEPVRRGMYYYNGSNLEQLSLLNAQAIIYHEVEPGHYWQSAMAFISKSITGYPRRSNAYTEGWAQYAVLLAYEEGAFRTPEEKYGHRILDAMMAARVLVDVGMNYFGYDSDWGLKVLKRYTLESDLQYRAHIARDTSDWQAQMLPYTFGAPEILRLREKARFELGGKFDERRFHDAVLSIGAVAFPILERHIDWFIEQEKHGAAPGICDD